MTFTFLEFFAGGGLARAGLGPGWRCLFANDVDAAKCRAYRANWGEDALVEGDIRRLGAPDLPRRRADLAWASFPCQDLSLAGRRDGLGGARSSLFFEFLRLLDALGADNRAPRAVVVENVVGLLTSSRGDDFRAVIVALARRGFRVGAMVLDARHFVPQSRPRLFVFGLVDDAAVAGAPPRPDDACAPRSLIDAVSTLPGEAQKAWFWPAGRPSPAAALRLADILDEAASWSAEAGAAIVAGMSPAQRAKIDALAATTGGAAIGAAFRRVRVEEGAKIARWEARFDGLAGCLRTPAGGSSVQRLLRVECGRTLARQLTPREAARLMGLPDAYRLPASKMQALKLCGDGVAAPVARWIAAAIVEPALAAGGRRAA